MTTITEADVEQAALDWLSASAGRWRTAWTSPQPFNRTFPNIAIRRTLTLQLDETCSYNWTMRPTPLHPRANLRRLVRRILRRHGYPPEKQEKATMTVLEQAEVLSEGWAVA